MFAVAEWVADGVMARSLPCTAPGPHGENPPILPHGGKTPDANAQHMADLRLKQAKKWEDFAENPCYSDAK